jgi:hypothetical protein
MSLPNHIPFGARQAVSKRWHEAKAAKRMDRGPDADTLRKRALDDARRQIVREGCTYTATGQTNWQVRRSIAGRVDQLDLVANGQTICTAGPRKMPARFRPQIKLARTLWRVFSP